MNDRNRIFAAAFDELRRTQGVKTQKDLALRMGVSEDTITRILKHGGRVTEDIITKLQTASGCIFNLQWLRGESDIMLSADLKKVPAIDDVPQVSREFAMAINAVTDAKDQTIRSLKRQLDAIEKKSEELIKEKEKRIATLEAQLQDKAALIDNLQQQIADMRSTIQEIDTERLFAKYPFGMGVADRGDVHKDVQQT